MDLEVFIEALKIPSYSFVKESDPAACHALATFEI